MKNLRQVKLMHTHFSKQLDRLMDELHRITLYIHKKREALHRIMDYQKQYTDEIPLTLTRSHPVLHKNLDFFQKKLSGIIEKESYDIEQLMKVKTEKLKEIEGVDNKVKLMSKFSENLRREQSRIVERIEQMEVDDMASNQRSRSYHE